VAGAVATRGGVALRCQDGDPTCDADGAADGTCTIQAALCVGVAGCGGAGVRDLDVRGPGREAFAAALEQLASAGSGVERCSAAVVVPVRRGRRARRRLALTASARDGGSPAADRDRLRLTCTRPPGARGGRAIVVTTDFETGLLATVRLTPPHRVGHPAVPIHADAVVRVAGDRVYVVNRFLGDNLQVLDPARGLATLLQCSTGAGSNPHDVAVAAPDKAYVTRFSRRELWVVDPAAPSCAGFLRDTIDLRPYADDDGLPEMDQMAIAGGRLFVTLERLDARREFAPAGRSALVVIDVATDQVVGTVELSGENAFAETSGLAREPGSGKLLIAQAGNIYRTGDGGIERVDPTALRAEGFFVTEDQLGGNVTDFVVVSPTKGYAIVLDDTLRNLLVVFDPSGASPPRRLLTRTHALPDVALAPDGMLWLADGMLPAPGLRIFDPADDRQLTRRAIDVGLPPFSIGFLP
jgi:hypothetical protein